MMKMEKVSKNILSILYIGSEEKLIKTKFNVTDSKEDTLYFCSLWAGTNIGLVSPPGKFLDSVFSFIKKEYVCGKRWGLGSWTAHYDVRMLKIYTTDSDLTLEQSLIKRWRKWLESIWQVFIVLQEESTVHITLGRVFWNKQFVRSVNEIHR